MLFQIDPRPFQAALDQAEGQLAQSQGQLEQARAQLAQAEAQVAVAEANQRRDQLDVDRYTPWRSSKRSPAGSGQRHAEQHGRQGAGAGGQGAGGNRRAQITAADAAVESAKAAVETARINLGFTRLTSPIDGIPGIAQQQVGALVSPASGAITTVSTLDPIKVYFTVSEQEYLEFARRFPTAEKRQAKERPLRTRADSRRRDHLSA